VLESVVNISEGQNSFLLEELTHSLASDFLDLHSDPDHHRSVFTMVGTAAPRILTARVVEALSLTDHVGVHPRLGVVDVVPFVPLADSTMDEALSARNDFAQWAWDELRVPTFFYGPERTLPDIRRNAWHALFPDIGDNMPHATAGAMCVGIREPLIAYNVWLRDSNLVEAKRIASTLRDDNLRTLGLQVGSSVQVSMNLIRPGFIGPMEAFDRVAACARIERAELVGLMPTSVLLEIPRTRWEKLDLAEEKTIEWRLANR
jgi:glutamate formiminotransferase